MAWDLLEKWRCPQIIPSSIRQSDTATVFQIGKLDRKTTFFRDLHRHYEGHMLPFGETVFWRDRNGSNCKFASSWVFGIRLHQECNVRMHAITTRQRAFLARAIRRLPPLEGHGTEVFLAVRGTPWLMRKGNHEEEVEDREHSNHQRDRSSQRARAMNNKSFHPRRNTRRDQHRKQLRFKDHTLQNMWSWEGKTTKIEKERPMTRSRRRNPECPQRRSSTGRDTRLCDDASHYHIQSCRQHEPS